MRLIHASLMKKRAARAICNLFWGSKPGGVVSGEPPVLSQ